MTLDEARDFIIKHYQEYIDKKVYFASTNETLVIKAIDITEDDNGQYDATCYTEDAFAEDANFENGIFEHRSLKDVIENGKLV
ncbi:MAG: hypothetical protein H0W73_15405 [Bacteroidetes bacterium]|nr:hypothetical protein [Bacteroidota bacterium]